MTILPDDFLQAARELNNQQSVAHPEARARTVAGRSYYAAFLATRQTIRHAYGDPSFDVDHYVLCRRLRGDQDTHVSQIGVRLDGLRRLRTRSDYRLARTVSQSDAIKSVSDSNFVVRNLPNIASRIPPNIPRKS